MTQSPLAGVVVYAKDIATMRAFYVSVAGFSIAHSEAGHIELRSSTMQLVLVRIPEAIAATIDIGEPPTRRTASPIKLMFDVASIATARAVAPQFGGEVLPAEREWEFQGSRVCDGHDPEGNIVQFRQPT